MVKVIYFLALTAILGGCSHTNWENPTIPEKVRPSSASTKPEVLTGQEEKYLKKDKQGRVIGRKFDKNRRNLDQSNRWINWRDRGWF